MFTRFGNLNLIFDDKIKNPLAAGVLFRVTAVRPLSRQCFVLLAFPKVPSIGRFHEPPSLFLRW